jgi:hypothetical protein
MTTPLTRKTQPSVQNSTASRKEKHSLQYKKTKPAVQETQRREQENTALGTGKYSLDHNKRDRD